MLCKENVDMHSIISAIFAISLDYFLDKIARCRNFILDVATKIASCNMAPNSLSLIILYVWPEELKLNLRVKYYVSFLSRCVKR
jgi:hypothetical protein